MQSQRVLSFFLENNTGAPQGEVLCLIKPLFNNSYNWTLSSFNSEGTILCKVIEIGDVPGSNSIVKSTSLYGGNPCSLFGKTFSYSQTTRRRLNSRLASFYRVRLVSQPINYSCHLESYTACGHSIVLIPLKHNTNIIRCVGSNPPTITINNDSVFR